MFLFVINTPNQPHRVEHEILVTLNSLNGIWLAQMKYENKEKKTGKMQMSLVGNLFFRLEFIS